MRIANTEALEQLCHAVSRPDVRVHFSQFGEDCLVWQVLEKYRDGFYVDIGCHHPTRYSNTFLLWQYRGWRGINIDADARAIDAFRHSRPADTNLHLGIGQNVGISSFTVFDDGAVNTFNPTLATTYASKFPGATKTQIEVRTLQSVLREYLPASTPVSYLNVDCEGMDEDVLRSSDWTTYRPDIVTVELHGLNLEKPLDNSTVCFLRDVGYKLRSFFWVTGFFERVE